MHVLVPDRQKKESTGTIENMTVFFFLIFLFLIFYASRSNRYVGDVIWGSVFLLIDLKLEKVLCAFSAK